MNNDLKIIKDNYGEKMMHLCRELFSTLLEKEGVLSSLILKKFNPSRFLYDDILENDMIADFKNAIYSLVDVGKQKNIETNKTPRELLEDVDYDLYECKTEEEIQMFKKYYEQDEKICTFNGGRLNRCYVFFVVKKDVDRIQRKAFKRPVRDDLYGTSVMSIQFTKGDINTLSIKNRYNHTVNNPDATLSNNLENIIPGLTKSFEREYNLNINQKEMNDFELPNYVRAGDGKYYKYNYEINNVYYCPDNIIIDNFGVKKFQKEKYIILDYFVLDLKRKKIYNYQESMNDGFPMGIYDIQKIDITKESNNKIIYIFTNTNNEIIIKLDKQNRIISYKNDKLDKLENKFLNYNTTLEILDIPNVKTICEDCLLHNQNLKKLNAPNVEQILNYFLYCNESLEQLNVPKLQKVGAYFLYKNKKLTIVNFTSLKEVSIYFLYYNKIIKKINFPKLEVIDSGFMVNNIELVSEKFPSLNERGRQTLMDEHNLRFEDKKHNDEDIIHSTPITKVKNKILIKNYN